MIHPWLRSELTRDGVTERRIELNDRLVAITSMQACPAALTLTGESEAQLQLGT
jgi:hypothetical protein